MSYGICSANSFKFRKSISTSEFSALLLHKIKIALWALALPAAFRQKRLLCWINVFFMQPLFCWHSQSGPCANAATGSYECHHLLPLTHKNTHGAFSLSLSLCFSLRDTCANALNSLCAWILRPFSCFCGLTSASKTGAGLGSVSHSGALPLLKDMWVSPQHYLYWGHAGFSHTHSHTDSNTPSLIYSHYSRLPTFPSAELRVWPNM